MWWDWRDRFRFHVETFRHFMCACKAAMTLHNNPYHNYFHILDVTQGAFVLLTRFHAAKFLTHLEACTLTKKGFLSSESVIHLTYISP